MTDAAILKLIRQLLASEDKPKTCSPIDVLQTIRFLIQHGAENEVGLSRGTLSLQLCCGESTIYESQQRLKGFEWVTIKKGKRNGSANRFTVLIDNLPLSNELKKTIVSDEGRKLSEWYRMTLGRLGKTRFMKGASQNYAFRLQFLLNNKCDGDFALLARILYFAATDYRYVPKFKQGPHELRKSWQSLRADYDAAEAARIKEQTPPTAAQEELQRMEAELNAALA